MTREMNKPDWHNKWVNKEEEKPSNSRELEDWIRVQIDSINERFKQCGKQ